ncbi:MAG: DUF3592 domain-containing protein [Planctomycetaceae bacterium]|nr:DUF3592 domain-containing protein [Planctomycetaceae bacterium]
MPKWLIIVVYWLSGACLVAAVGYWIGEDSYRLSTQGRTAIATVTRIEKRTTGSGQNTQTSTVHHVRFESADAQIHQGVIDAGWFAPETGETIEILYDPSDPSTVQANKFLSLWAPPFFLVAAVLCCLWFLRPRQPANLDERNVPSSN